MNLHPTQSYETDVEIDMLTNAKNNIITPQESKPAISVTQDALVGSYLMTMKNEDIDREVFFDITMKGQILKNNKYVDVWDEDRVEQIQEILEKYDKEPNVFNGRGLFSLILPATFNYSKENKTHPKEPVVKIIKGVLIEGTLDKNVLGTTHGSIIQFLNKEYGCEITANFIDNVQFMANDWLLSFGFSIGLEDCLITSKENTDEIKNELMKYYMKAQAVEESTINPGIREIRVMGSLSQAKDIGMKIAKDAMKPDNNFLSSVNSGAKGDFFNIAQITGLLGQQNLEGKRVTPQLNNGKRTLPHYPFEIKDIEKKYESRGFIRHSFIRGLNPEEFFFHSMSGREGISDTSMGTSESGYLQRKIVKLFEDIQIQQDGTVRNNNKKIIQFAYGDNMLDPVKTVKVDGKMQFCDIKRLSEKLNNMYENNEEIKTKKEPEIEYEIIKPVKNNKRKKIIKQIKDIDPSINTNNYSVEDLAEKLERLKLEKKNQTEEEDEENNYNLEDITESSEEDTENSKLVSTDFDDEEHEEKEYNEELEREENSDDDDDEDNSIVDDDFDEDNYDMSEEPVMNYEED
jgi:DNA-directed RNA polymerase beta' subunit